jgi:diguanylate cyclase (GGDEF)-like protein
MINNALYPPFATGLVLVLILADYLSRANTDHFQRRLYLSALLSILGAILFNFASTMLDGRPGPTVRAFLHITNNVFFIFQHLSYYLAVVFIDYLVNKNDARVRKLLYLVLGLMVLNLLVMVLNISGGFYFYFTPDNRFQNGGFFLVRFYLGYIAILILVVDLLISAKHLKGVHITLIVVFAVLFGIGTALDTFFVDGHLIWAFFTGGLLYGYFFIIRSDTTRDSMTGIGNRSGFSEFISQVARMNTRQSYAMALFDINGLKKINDAHGQEAGDRALAEMAEILKKCSRQSDFLARIGGDEFIIAIKAKFDIEKMLARVLKTLDTYNQKPDRLYTLSISYGYDTFSTKTDTTIEEFLQRLNGLVFQHKKDQRHEEAALAR